MERRGYKEARFENTGKNSNRDTSRGKMAFHQNGTAMRTGQHLKSDFGIWSTGSAEGNNIKQGRVQDFVNTTFAQRFSTGCGREVKERSQTATKRESTPRFKNQKSPRGRPKGQKQGATASVYFGRARIGWNAHGKFQRRSCFATFQKNTFQTLATGRREHLHVDFLDGAAGLVDTGSARQQPRGLSRS